MIVVSDTSPLSGLAIVGKLSLLQALYGQIVIPEAVASELRRGGQDNPRIAQVLTLSWLETKGRGLNKKRFRRSVGFGFDCAQPAAVTDSEP